MPQTGHSRVRLARHNSDLVNRPPKRQRHYRMARFMVSREPGFAYIARKRCIIPLILHTISPWIEIYSDTVQCNILGAMSQGFCIYFTCKVFCLLIFCQTDK